MQIGDTFDLYLANGSDTFPIRKGRLVNVAQGQCLVLDESSGYRLTEAFPYDWFNNGRRLTEREVEILDSLLRDCEYTRTKPAPLPTYKVGDRFMMNGVEGRMFFILAQTGEFGVRLINTESNRAWKWHDTRIESPQRITKAEFDAACGLNAGRFEKLN